MQIINIKDGSHIQEILWLGRIVFSHSSDMGILTLTSRINLIQADVAFFFLLILNVLHCLSVMIGYRCRVVDPQPSGADHLLGITNSAPAGR